MTSDVSEVDVLPRLQRLSLIVGVVAAIPTTIGVFFQPVLFFPAYLVGFLFWWSIAVGCLAVACLHQLTGGGWGNAIRRPLEAGMGTLPLVAILFLPVLFGMPILYEWARPESVALDPGLRQKISYLNVEFYELRAAVYFAVWIGFAWSINRLSIGGGAAQDRRRRDWLVALGGPGMIAWGLTVTFAAIDWTMSLEPHWMSSIYGLIFMAGQVVSALAFVLFVTLPLRHLPSIGRALDESRLLDLGNLLFAFILFWTYTSFTQYLVIWCGNLPEETAWYLRRDHGGWQYVALMLIGLLFAVPFLLLLNRPLKRSPHHLWTIAALLLGMRLVEFYWQVMPTFSASALSTNWLLLCTPVAIGGLWLAAFFRNLNQGLALPLLETHMLEEVPHG